MEILTTFEVITGFKFNNFKFKIRSCIDLDDSTKYVIQFGDVYLTEDYNYASMYIHAKLFNTSGESLVFLLKYLETK